MNICGGEPTLYPELKDLVAGMIARKKYMIMCTNALRLEDKVYAVIPPTDHLFLMVHLDGMRETHDHVTNRKGVFDKAVAMVRKGKELGYHVFLNTTVFKQTNVEEIEDLCKLVDELKANGILVAPGYEYESVERDIFLTKAQIHEKFQAIRAFSCKYKVCATPTFLEFAARYLDLRHFAPALVPHCFPALGDPGRIDALLAEDVDAGALLAATRPEGAA